MSIAESFLVDLSLGLPRISSEPAPRGLGGDSCCSYGEREVVDELERLKWSIEIELEERSAGDVSYPIIPDCQSGGSGEGRITSS